MKNAYANIVDRTYGVELEFTGIYRKKAARVLAGCVGYTGEIVADDNSCYKTIKVVDQQGRKWKVTRDASVAGGGSHSCELITPILRGHEDRELLEKIADALVAAGGYTDRSCGMHVHVGTEDYSVQKMRTLQNTWAAHEDLLYMCCLVDSEHRDTRYCEMTEPRFLEAINKKKPQDWEAFWSAWYGEDNAYSRNSHYNNSRYRGLNLHSAYQHNNVEFRLFNGTLDSTAINAAVLFCLCLVEDTFRRKGGATCKKVDLENPAFMMRTWTNRLGLIGPEFATARRWLYETLPGNAAWRYGNDTKRRKVSKLER